MIVQGSILAIDRANIDTDQIIPARYLTGITKSGLGQFLFSGLPGGPEMLVQNPQATILVTRENFGCGSSREHAAWALLDHGFKAVIAPSFARIFHENAYNNGIVPVELPTDLISEIMQNASVSIDVEAEVLQLENGKTVRFTLDPLRKQFILGGGFMRYLAGKVSQVRAWEAETHALPGI